MSEFDATKLIDGFTRRMVAAQGPPTFPDEDFDSPEEAEAYRREFCAKYSDEIVEWLESPSPIRNLITGAGDGGTVSIPYWQPNGA